MCLLSPCECLFFLLTVEGWLITVQLLQPHFDRQHIAAAHRRVLFSFFFSLFCSRWSLGTKTNCFLVRNCWYAMHKRKKNQLKLKHEASTCAFLCHTFFGCNNMEACLWEILLQTPLNWVFFLALIFLMTIYFSQVVWFSFCPLFAPVWICCCTFQSTGFLAALHSLALAHSSLLPCSLFFFFPSSGVLRHSDPLPVPSSLWCRVCVNVNVNGFCFCSFFTAYTPPPASLLFSFNTTNPSPLTLLLSPCATERSVLFGSGSGYRELCHGWLPGDPWQSTVPLLCMQGMLARFTPALMKRAAHYDADKRILWKFLGKEVFFPSSSMFVQRSRQFSFSFFFYLVHICL